MKKIFNSTLKNIELLPVFIPFILCFSSWTIYEVTHNDDVVGRKTKISHERFRDYKINSNFLATLNDKTEKTKYKYNSEKNKIEDSVSINNLISNNIISNDQLKNRLSKEKLSYLNFNPNLVESGYIGEIGNKDSEKRDANASDNIFDVHLSSLDPKKSYTLKYEIDGYSDMNSVTRSINGSFAVGGYIKHKKKGWFEINELLDPSMLKNGENKILFNAINKGDYYAIKNVRITESGNISSAPYTIVSKIYNDKAIYIRGFISDKSGIQSLEVRGEKVDLQGNEFEYFSKDNLLADAIAVKFKGQNYVNEIVVAKTNEAYSSTEISSYDNNSKNIIYETNSGSLKGLRLIDIPPIDLSTVNVSDRYYGFRFKSNDNIKIETEFHLPYDKDKLPKGYSETDITAFRFDYDRKEWTHITVDSINTVKKYAVIHSSLSGDFMLGVVKQPENPETGAGANITFDDSPIANPASKINLIAPPTPNQQGSAIVTYPIEIPAGIGGFQPSVSLVYNSDNKFGWAGTSWDIPVETIDIDTRWGVPSFGSQETEIYLIAGEQLVFKDDYLPNKLPYAEARTSNRRFYFRNGIKEGYIITRKGSSPAGYTWEILDGSGTKKEYLDVLTNHSSNNTSGNRIKWFLSKVTDKFGNTITYTYADSYEGGGKNKYLSKITYSNNTVIEFENEPGVRADKTFNYKLGVKLTDAKILNKISVKRANIKIREYQLVNTTAGIFSKRLLTQIIQKDGKGNIFNKHIFGYDNNVKVFNKDAPKVYSTPKDNADVGSFSGGNTSFISGTYSKNKNIRGAISFGGGLCFLFGISKTGTVGITASYDDNSAYGKNQLVDIDGDGLLDKVFYSANGNIHFRKNTKTGFSSVYSSTGLPGGTPIHRNNSYNTTLGLEYSFRRGVVGANYSFGNSNSPTYFSDVNADGLVDMINYGDVYFSKIRNGVPQFKSQPVGGTVNVTEETPNAILAGSGVVQDTIITTTFSSSLANIVRMWEAPVSGNIRIHNAISLIQNSQDGVEVWIEKGEMRKINEDTQGYNPANSTLISSKFTLSNQTPQQDLSAATYVEKGQRIFIVTSSKNDQTGDRVRADTNISYTSVSGVSDLNTQDANNNNYFKFNAKSHYLASSQKPNVIGDKSKVNISWNTLNNETFTDDVEFKIYKTIRSISDTTGTIPPSANILIYRHKLIKGEDLSSVTAANNEIANSDISNLLVNQNPSDSTMTLLRFDVSADTNVSWEKIKWRPSFAVMSATDTTVVKALVQYNPYSERLTNTLPQNFKKYVDKNFCIGKENCPRCDTSSYVFPNFNGNGSLNDYTINLPSPHNTTVTFSLKIKDKNGEVYTAKNIVSVVNNVMPIPKIDICTLFATIPFRYEEICLFPFYFEISSSDYVVAKKLASVNPKIFHTSFVGYPYLENTDHQADYFAYRSANTHYNTNTGIVYQGWGGFSYNGSKYPNEAIRESQFLSNPLANVPSPGGTSPCNPTAPDYFTCMTNYIMQQNNNRYFTPLELDAEKYAYISPLEPVELGQEEIQSYLLGVSSSSSTTVTTPVFAVPNPRGIILRSTSDSFHGYAAGSILPWLGISGHVGFSTEKTSDYFQDFNGDRYPDIISGKYYQKTNILGQLSPSAIISAKEIKNKAFILGGGISASASTAKFSNTANTHNAVAGEKDTHTASSSFALGASVNINIGKAWAEGTGVWADMNGDGLTDYISGGNTYINTGNGFVVDNNSWNVSDVSKTNSFAVSGGGGFSTANGSWAGGVGLSKSKSTAEVGLIDVNGDGLADKIIKNGSSYEMWINNGTSFVSMNMNRDFSLDNKQNSSGFNLYGTLCACFGLKICVSAGGGTDKSVTKQEVDLRDFDGDGYPDLLLSESDNQLTYYHNNFPNANLLLTIENPLQGLIMMQYDNVNQQDNAATLVGGTYQMPFSKMVLTRSAIWNFRPIDTTLPYIGVNQVLDPQKIKPQQRFYFEYEKGIQDRREREFLGFGIVKTKIFNDQVLHQTHVTQYETDYTGSENNFYVNFNDSKVRQYFYKKGLVRSSYLLDSQNRKRSETKYTYRYFDQSPATGYQLTETQTQPIYKDIGRIIPLLYKTESTFTEFSGSNSHSKTTINTIDAYDKFGNITRSTYRGQTLANTADDVVTNRSYHPPGTKNITGIPAEQTIVVNNNEILRKSTTVLDAAQNIKQIKKDLLGSGYGASGIAVFDMEYDVYGNMKKMTKPASENGQRMSYNFVYDPTYHTYLISTTDSYNFTSTTEYDSNYLFGIPTKITGINGAVSRYTYDSFGRVIQYLAPTDTDWTVKMHYYPSEKIPVAITERKEAGFSVGYSDPKNLNYFVSLFTDAWGEGMMTKKLIKKEDKNYYFANNVYQIKDKLGRPVKTILTDKVTTGTDIMTSLKLFDDYTTPEDQAAQIYSTTEYDGLNRPVKITQKNVVTNGNPQNLTTQIFYEFGTDRAGKTQFATRTVSPLGNTTVTYTDEKGRTTSGKQTNGNENLWVSYSYNHLDQLTEMNDAANNTTKYDYDKFGRNIFTLHPDAGASYFKYDLSGKLTGSDNAILKSIGSEINYRYNYDQLTQIEYPDHSVSYQYGDQNGPNEEKGRLIKQTDRTGTQNFKYDLLGNVRENMRIVVAPNNVPKMFKTSYVHDIYGRINKIFYPDTEEITYTYNTIGQLDNIMSKLPGKGKPTAIAHSMTYDNRGQMTSYLAGNGTETRYDYDPWSRVSSLSLSYNNNNNGSYDILENKYIFDGNNNLAEMQGLTPMNGNLPSVDFAIGTLKQYTYDAFGRLKSANIKAEGQTSNKYYKLNMKYNAVGNMEIKDSKLKTYSYYGSLCQNPPNEGDVGVYEYDNPNHPNAVSAIHYTKFENFIAPSDCGAAPVDPSVNAREAFEYDLNGNLVSILEQDANGYVGYRDMVWDHQNRLKAVITQKENLNYYVYDASGERILKNDAVSKNLYTNGNDPANTTQMGAFTYYPNGYLVLSEKTMSKHYYMGGQKIATRVGDVPTHRFKINVGDEYEELATALLNEISIIIEENGLPQAVWVQNEDSQGTYTSPTSSTYDDTLCSFLIEQQIYTLQQDGNEDCFYKLMEMYQNALDSGGTFCDTWNQFLSNDCMNGYTPPEISASEMYWVQPDHLSGTSIVTNSDGKVTNWYEYMPYGEMLMESSIIDDYNHPYKYNGKEFDMATGYYYYGARYYDPKRSFWLSVDPLADITLSPYAYVWNDPVNFADPTGLMGERIGGKNPKDWYRDRFGNVSWHDSQEDQIKGKNGETLTRLGKSGSYLNINRKVTTLNPDRTVTEEGSTSIIIAPTQMSQSAMSGNNSAQVSSPRKTTFYFNNFDTSKYYPVEFDRHAASGFRPALMDPSAAMFRFYAEAQIGGYLFRGLKNILFYEKVLSKTPKTIDYSKILSSADEFDPTITLYRGTTGSESTSSLLFLTDDAAVASSYIQNGGQLMKYEISRSGLYILEHSGKLRMGTGIRNGSNIVSTEYEFIGKDVVNAVNKLAKPNP